MAAKKKTLWQILAAQLLLVAVPLYGSLPELATIAATRATDLIEARALERSDARELVATCVLEVYSALAREENRDAARASWGSKPHVRASSLAEEKQPQAILEVTCEIASRDFVYDHKYDANGNRESLLFPNGVATTYAYNTKNQLLNISTVNGAGTTLVSFAYTLAPTGNRTKIVEHDGVTRNYAYDALYRLTDEHVRQGTAPDAPAAWRNQFAYDPVGNRLEQLRQTENGTELKRCHPNSKSSGVGSKGSASP